MLSLHYVKRAIHNNMNLYTVTVKILYVAYVFIRHLELRFSLIYKAFNFSQWDALCLSGKIAFCCSIFFKEIFVYLKCRVTDREKRQRSFIYQFIPQMAAINMIGPDWHQETWNSLDSPLWMPGAQALETFSAAFAACWITSELARLQQHTYGCWCWPRLLYQLLHNTLEMFTSLGLPW